MKIDPTYVQQARDVETVEELRALVQKAIELEHATIPPYLCGYFTLKLGTNEAVGDIIRSVAIEEMLHMTIACNLLLAIGGRPRINTPDFVPSYPDGLPFGIGDEEEPDGDEKTFKVHLRKCSRMQVEDVFMKIEEPDQILDIPDVDMLGEEQRHFDTIGDFYLFLIAAIERLGPSIFKDGHPQIIARKWFPNPKEMFEITDVETACEAIRVIVDQGEGSKDDPFDEFGEPSHYYRFQEIIKGRKLIRVPDADPPYAYAGEPVVLDDLDVWNMDTNASISKYKPGSMSERMAIQFSYSYTRALNALHDTFNGRPEALDDAMGIMYELRLLAQQVLSTPAEWADASNKQQAQTGLSFEYRTTNT
ncbi:ferritin-like domain-containing protein [Shimia ponticola]|uniref:ferritin-like domain-containing protein n=1 Tax=Shimia ponticola TaxID=2582893 RepID=UPI0011BE69F4|nr:ferritin-like protein [Shimia ponticola]